MWIEVHEGIFRHRKIVSLAAALDVPRMSAGGHVVSLWLWALSNAPDGDLSKIPSDVIAFGAEWDGDPNIFVNSMIDVGLLDLEGENLHIHDWYEYAGKLIEKRKKDAERKRVHRMSTGQDADVRVTAQVPNLTVPNLTKEENGADAPSHTEDWLETLRGIKGWEEKGEPHLSSLRNWIQKKNIGGDALERAAIGLAGVQEKTLRGYANFVAAFQRRINEGYDTKVQLNGHKEWTDEELRELTGSDDPIDWDDYRARNRR